MRGPLPRCADRRQRPGCRPARRSRRGPGRRSPGRGRRRAGDTMNGAPGATAMPCAARVSIATCWSSTASHRLMPSSAVAVTPRAARAREQRGAAAGVLGAGRGRPGHRRRVGQQVEQHRLQQPADDQPGPSSRRSATAAISAGRPADRGQPQVGAVALGEAGHVHGPVRAGARPRLTGGAEAMSPAWSSSTTITSG